MLEPLTNRILIERDKPAEQIGMIILPDSAKQDSQQIGTVLAIGPDANCGVSSGDRIVFSRYGAVEIAVEGKEYVIATEDQIYARIVEDAA